jgi:hypothetical protein
MTNAVLLAALLAVPTGAPIPGPDAPPTATAPAPTRASSTLAVFFDCQTWICRDDARYFRTEITFVDWVRIREAAQVHLILTQQDTGGGGNQFLLDFIGLGPLEGTNDRLVHTADRDATEDEMLAGITRVLAIGLARYAALAGFATELEVVAPVNPDAAGDPGDRPPPGLQGDVDDPWNFWVFRVGMEAGLEGQDRQSEWEVGGRLSANRTTDTWKILLDLGGEWEERDFELTDSTRFVDRSRNWEGRARVVRSLAPHWSLATELGASASTFLNQDLSARVGAGIEYSVFPYAEATRRRLTATYMVFARHLKYEEETLFDRFEETVGQHGMELALDFRQPWGEAGVGIEASQYLHDLARNRLSMDGELEFRIYRGLSLELEAEISRIRDQIYLAKEGASDEDILTQRRQLATNFDYELSAGFSFSFGSIFNNVVNNRFRTGFF